MTGTGEDGWENRGYIYFWAGKNDRRVSGGLSFVVWISQRDHIHPRSISLRVISGSIHNRQHSPITARSSFDHNHHVLPSPSLVLSQDPPCKTFITGLHPETALWSAVFFILTRQAYLQPCSSTLSSKNPHMWFCLGKRCWWQGCLDRLDFI